MQAQRDEIIAEIERRRFDLSLGLLRIYNYYRTLVGFALLAVFEQNIFSSFLGDHAPNLFRWVCIGYTFLNILSAVLVPLLPQRWFSRQYISLVTVLFDVFALVFLTYCSGGVGSGLAALILVAVAAGAIIISGRLATLVAAAATIALLYEEFYIAISSPGLGYDFFQAGIFGIIYFTASVSIHYLSQRLRDNDIRALTQAAELADLERLNRQIIQRMRTGIIVVDPNNQVRMFNQSARALLAVEPDVDMAELPEKLEVLLEEWREDTALRTPPFQPNAYSPEIRVNFSAVRNGDAKADITIFLEDTGEIQQQAQQLKLAELGRLSASIAHEVRNPLGAISHAAQLLNESSDLVNADQRLADIIVSHCKRMDGVVANVLEMSRRRTPEPVRLNLAAHLEDFADTFRQAVPDADIDLLIEPTDTEIRVDPTQLSQALTNLVQNGVRYSAENGSGQKVTLQGGLDRGTDRPFLNVLDYGIGVEEEQVPKLFQPFSTTAIGGTGLGLYISRELCESNHAKLSYSPRPEGGSCFRILFAHPDRLTA